MGRDHIEQYQVTVHMGEGETLWWHTSVSRAI